MGSSSSRCGFSDLRQCCPATSVAGNDSGGLAGVLRAQTGIDGGERPVSFIALGRDQQLHLCRQYRRVRTAS